MTESVADAAIQETFEETGIRVEVTGLLGVYSDPRREFSVVLKARPVGGEPTVSAESSEVRWVPPGDLADFKMGPAMRRRVDDYLRGSGVPVIA